MSDLKVFLKMASYYHNTGQIMQDEKFIDSIVRNFDKSDVVKGLMIFNDYLDDLRKKEGA